jgi:hypothetical protein
MKMVRMIFIIATTVGALSSILNFAAVTVHKKSILALLFGFVAGPLFIVVFFLLGILLLSFLIYQFKRDLISSITYRFTEWGVEKTSARFNISVAWKEFIGFRETKLFFYLFLKTDCTVIPKRMFNNTAELDQFRTLIETHIIQQ